MTTSLPNRCLLAATPTPIQELKSLSENLGVRIRVKRDDLTGSHLSGNKIRKLEYLLAEALELQSTHVITCGGIQSNHCRATALAARPLGLQPVLMLRTANGTMDDLPVPATGNVLLDKLAGATFKPCTPEEYKDRTARMEALADAYRAEGGRPYIVPEGGSNALGSYGYVAAAQEIADQLGDCLPDSVIVPTGSGGTVAGLAIGFKHLGLPVKVFGVPVCDDGPTFRAVAEQIAEAAHKRFGLPQLQTGDLHFLEGFQGPGYALSTREGLTFIRDAVRNDGLVLDPVYTGKAFQGMVQTVKTDPSRLGKDVLFIHTGGVFGLFPAAAELETVLDFPS